MVMRSPPSTRARSVDQEKKLMEEMKNYRKLLQKVARMKTKILFALREEGCREAADMLQTPPREVGAVRCNNCQGCTVRTTQGGCGNCLDCEKDGDCTEHSRLCFSWRQPPTTYVAGSIITGVSSGCNLVDYDITKYCELVDKLGDVSIEIESTLDTFPAGSDIQRNDRFSQARRDRDIANEDESLSIIETLLNRYQEKTSRLDDVRSDGEDEAPNDAVSVRGGSSPPRHEDRATPVVHPPEENAGRFGLMSQTNRLYPFGEETDLVARGVTTGLAAENLVDNEGGSFDALGLGAELDLIPWDAPILQPRRQQEEPTVAAEVEDRRGEPQKIVNLDAAATTEQPEVVPRQQEPVVRQPGSHFPGSNKPAVSITIFNPIVISTASPVTKASCTTTTTVTSSTRTTPTASLSLGDHTMGGSGSQRRRSVSLGEQDIPPTGQPCQESRRIAQVKMLVAARTQAVSQDLVVLLDRVRASDQLPLTWVDEEVRQIQSRLEKLEEMESEVWMITLRLEGKSAQKRRVERWEEWLARQRERVRKIKDRMWDIRRDTPSHSETRGCSRSSGHLKKVKLPTFNGKQEYFSQFKVQFRELCKGERYTPILEMAQLRLKLPRDALSAITGMQCPEKAWARLEEIYGNREMSILSALKALREFRTTKIAPHEQLIELAMAVQKCQTELANISTEYEFLGDREAIACVIHALPQTVRDKWYDCDIPSDTAKKGEYLVAWLEAQREKAIRVRLDTMAAKLRGEPDTTPKAKPKLESTDKGLQSQALHALDSSSSAADNSSCVTPAG